MSVSTSCLYIFCLYFFVYILLVVFAGLSLAQMASSVYDTAQPALLYLVPCTLLPFILKAHLEVGSYCVHALS